MHWAHLREAEWAIVVSSADAKASKAKESKNFI
jgi:hypothetical protein